MNVEQKIISESSLSSEELEPSETFARLVGRLGAQLGIGTLGLGAIQQIVQQRAQQGYAPATAAPTLPVQESPKTV